MLISEFIQQLQDLCDNEGDMEIVIGHDYLVVDTKHGVCVIHAESCPCHKNK